MTLQQVIDEASLTVAADLRLADVISIMMQTRACCLLVAEQQQLVGIFTERDLLQWTTSHQDWDNIAIAEITNREVMTVLEADTSDPFLLLKLLRQHRIHYLPVVTAQGEIVGLVTQTRLLEALQDQVLGQYEQLEKVRDQLHQVLEQHCYTEQQTAELAHINAQLSQELSIYKDLEQQLQNSEQALNLSQERLESILSSIEDVVWSTTPYTAQLLYLNAATERVYGRKVAEFIQNLDLWQDVIHVDDRARVDQANQALYASGRQDLEYRIVWPNGQERWIHARSRVICDADGNPMRIDGIMTDISERHRIQEQLRHDALHDGLTGLANRTLLKDRLEQACNRNSRKENSLFAVLFLDLDRFKIINDSLGHPAGDQLLMVVADRLKKCQRAEDTVARLGGDEFVILLEDLETMNDALKVADRIHQLLRVPILINGSEVFISASIGIAYSTGPTCTQQDWVANVLREADTAMYRAKARGQGFHEVFDPSMHTAAMQQMQIENDLRGALLNSEEVDGKWSELLVYYQPIIDLTNSQIQGFEALVRWQHPEKGLIPPAEFIPIAEETGLVVKVDQWVLRTACQQMSALKRMMPHLPPLFMSVNLSGKHFAQPGLIPFLDEVLSKIHLEGVNLKLEITETTVIENSEAASRIIQQLQERNIQVSLDDFGTGYSSLSYLNSFPFNSLKIDRSFVHQLDLTGDAIARNEIVKAIVNLGLTLGMSVVAEGVETQEQATQLQSFNCQYGQGYLFAHPMNQQAMEAFLRESDLARV